MINEFLRIEIRTGDKKIDNLNKTFFFSFLFFIQGEMSFTKKIILIHVLNLQPPL